MRFSAFTAIARVQSLVRELRFQKTQGAERKKQKTKLILKSFFNKYVLSVYFMPSTDCPRFWEYWNQLERRDYERRWSSGP